MDVRMEADFVGTGAASARVNEGVLQQSIDRAARVLMDRQAADGHWVFDLEADATIPAEYILLKHHLGEEPDPEIARRIGNYLRRIQGSHGGWPLFHNGAFNISASVKAYFALKAIGDDIDAPHMARARQAIRDNGGAAASNVFTRIMLAQFGAVPWTAVPVMPVEIMLLPKWFPFHLTKISYWARTVIVPLLILMALKSKAKNPRNLRIDELFLVPADQVKSWPKAPHVKKPWGEIFGVVDRVLRVVQPYFPKKSRDKAIEKAVAFVRERLNGEDGLGAIYPAMANTVMMFDLLGWSPKHPEVATARYAIEKLLVIDEARDEAFCQPCVSPVWDTSLLCHAMLEVGTDEALARTGQALEWLKGEQVLDVKGDWADQRPNVRPGGWAFQYGNDHYPDLDDTAVVVMAFNRAQPQLAAAGLPADYDMTVARGAEWVEGLQSRNGGWGAFDADNTHYYLNYIPFSDHGALLDPPTSDVTGRCLGMMAQLGADKDGKAMREGVDYLLKEQEKDGSWFGRWGVNYIYGTWSALNGLNAAGLPPDHPAMKRAVDWLVQIQNPDGGWGEDCESYALDYSGYQPFPSTASQTAWALLGLMAAGAVEHPAVARGIDWLTRNQGEDGLWKEEYYSGGGFPRIFYLRYHGYSKYFPLWAMARYRNLSNSNSKLVSVGL
ncbi:squalene-hopene/tetraprenyl-beta-curcumene cyclase [Nitrospirillum amazonense]|uniref:Squalene-hopene/tetraprenyl-beta-curcumene cyclase n=2 Tax=Nitrospirillum amazonense TaxID=28077 RepID=A0A560JIW2_9PROT|nr:squalene-hopene/tetraprenyl-beta-curcumene cyclase [Nitrospirillum amazonense]